jgi:signal transduction histidine kinase
MKPEPPPLSQSYQQTLRRHLRPGASASRKAARKLGLRAVALGLETLDLARLHEEALLVLVSPQLSTFTSEVLIRRAGAFFAEALTPIEETHRGALEANVELKVMVGRLTQRTDELATANSELQREIAQRKAVEDSLRTSEATSHRLLEKSRLMQEELRLLSHRLLSVQEEERKRISRELHDVIGQTLAGINLRLATLKSQTTAHAKELHRKIAVTQRLVEKSVAIVHRFARDLRPAVLDDLGLIPALQSCIKSYQQETGLRVTFNAYAGVEKQDSAVRTVLYRVVQEALSNVARHAKASHVSVRILSRKGAVAMEITDNGQGFAVEGALFAKTSKRLGLLGMRERVEMVGGTFCVESAPGQETTIRAEIPPRGSAKKQLRRKSAYPLLTCP